MTDAGHRAHLAQNVSALLGTECSDAMMNAILGVRENYLAAALDELRQQYGSVTDYLRTHAGLDTARMDALRDLYLES